MTPGWAAQHIGFGPIERDNRRYAIAFWPDTKGFARKALDRLTAKQDPVVDDPDAFEKISVAGRGLLALERLLYNQDGAIALEEGYPCRLAQAIATDLAHNSANVLSEWQAADAPAASPRDLFVSLDAGLQALDRPPSWPPARQLQQTAPAPGRGVALWPLSAQHSALADGAADAA